MGKERCLPGWPDLRTRARDLELIDDPTIDGAELTQALHELRRINTLLAAGWVTLEGVARLWRAAGRPAQLSLIDVGAGSGGSNRLLLRWAQHKGIELRIALIDINADACTAARQLYADEPRVQIEQADLFQLAPQRADIVTASLVAHHIPDEQLPAILLALARAARVGVVINDLQRHWLAWAAITLATRVFSRNRLIRHDAPLSVRRGFRRAELARLRATPELSALRYTWRPFFRYLLLLPTGHTVAGSELPDA